MFLSLVLAVPWICNIAYCSHRSTSQMWQQKGRESDYSTPVIHIPIYTYSMLVLCAWTNNHLHEKLHQQCTFTLESSHFPFLIWMLHKVTIHIKSTTAHERLCGNKWTQCNKIVAGECSSSTTGPWVYYCQRSLKCEGDQLHYISFHRFSCNHFSAGIIYCSSPG